MAVNLTTKYSAKVDERFKLKSLTDAHAGHSYEFTGAKGIKIYSIDTVPIVDYTRSGLNRFGEVEELGDHVQELLMTQDKAFTFSIDKGNAEDQLNVKQVSKGLRTHWDERATPLIDKYRFLKWANGAGLGRTGSTLTKTTALEAIFTAGGDMSNLLVPMENRTLFIKQSVYVQVKLADQIVGIDKLGEKSISRGVVGMLDNMKVVPVPDSYFPTGVEFLIKYKHATVDPMKMKTFRVHRNPRGIDGDVGECRFYHDAFVLGSKANGLFVYASSGVVAAPSITITSNSATVTCSTNGATIKYTTDGTNPKTSDTAATYSSAVTLTSGQKIRAYASKSGSLDSAVAEAVN